jgi:hypothetical protein
VAPEQSLDVLLEQADPKLDHPEEVERLIASLRQGQASSGPVWESHLTQRLRTLIVMDPLFRLRRDGRLPDGGSHYDPLALVIKAFELIVENTGLDDEMTKERLQEELVPLLTAMDIHHGVEPDESRHRNVAEYVIDWLRNEDSRRGPFQVEYPDISENGEVHKRVLQFRLVEDRLGFDDITLRLSDEGANLYLTVLQTDLEDAQEAAGAILQSQIRRGKIEKAVATALTARALSAQYANYIEDVLIRTRRDVGNVDWDEEVPVRLDEAFEHIRRRQEADDHIMHSAKERLAKLAPGSSDARKMAQVHDLVRECITRHARLLTRVMSARSVFLMEQSRQLFRPRVETPLADYTNDILVPLLRMSEADAVKLLDRAFPHYVGLNIPRIPDLGSMIEHMLQPRRGPRSVGVPIPKRRVSEGGTEPLLFPQELQVEGNRIIADAPSGTRLSELLQATAHAGGSPLLLDYVATRVLQLYAPDAEETASTRAVRVEGERFRFGKIEGDELVVMNPEAEGGSGAND